MSGLPQGSTVRVCKDNDGVTAELKKCLASVLSRTSGQAVIGLSGGSLPKFFAAAVKQMAEAGCSWDKVKFIFCDERLVAFDDADSTFGVFDNLLLKDPEVQ